MKFDNKMLKPLICKYTANTNENLNLTSSFGPRRKLILGKGRPVQRLIRSLNPFLKMQPYDYQDIIFQYIIYARKKIDIFMKCFYSSGFIRSDSFYE